MVDVISFKPHTFITMSIRIFNREDGATVYVPEILVTGSSSNASGIIEVSHKDLSFPSQAFEVNHHFFKALVHLNPGSNSLVFTHRSGRFQNGYPEFDKVPQFDEITGKLHLTYSEELNANPPIHLCLLAGRNSQYCIDSPSYRIRSEGNDVRTAVKKLRFSARLIQAFFEEQFARAGFGNRTLKFAEQEDLDTITTKTSQTTRRTVKVHVVPIDNTVEEIREASNPNWFAAVAGIALQKYGNPFNPGSGTKAVCLFLDSHWNVHTQSPEGDFRKVGIREDRSAFVSVVGSQFLWALPLSYEDLYPAFSEIFPVDTNQVSNEYDVSGTAWEAANTALATVISSVAMLFGVNILGFDEEPALYYSLNRAFMTKEYYCSRTSQPGISPVLAKDEYELSRGVLVNLANYKEFRLVQDLNDSQYPLAASNDVIPQCYAIRGDRLLFHSPYGISLIELFNDSGTVGAVEFLPISCGGRGLVKEFAYTADELRRFLFEGKRGLSFSLRIYAIGSQEERIIARPIDLINDHKEGLGDRVGLRGNTQFYNGLLAGGDGGGDSPPVYFNFQVSYKIKVSFTDELYVHGIEVFMRGHGGKDYVALFGNTNGRCEEFYFEPGETLGSFRLRSGLYIDAIQIVTSNGRLSPMYGNALGGHLEELKAPPGYKIIGLRGRYGAWMDAIGVVYGRLE